MPTTTNGSSSPRTESSETAIYSTALRALLIVTTGNIQNRDLLALFERHIDVIAEYLTDSPLVELSRDRLIAHSSNGTRQ